MSTYLLVAPHPFAAKAFAAKEIHYDFHESPLLGCRAIIPLQSLQTHVRDCPYNPDSGVSSLPTVVTESFTVKEILACYNQHLKGSTSLELLGHVVGSMSVDGVLDVRSSTKGGKPQTWTRVSQGTKSNEDISTSHTQRRSSELKRLSLTVSGSAESAAAQQVYDVKVMSKRRRDGLSQDAGLTGSSLVSGLALKADMHLTWVSLRKLRVWLREFGIYLQSERCSRAEMETELPFHFISEKVPMCDKSGHVILYATVAVPDLMGLVLHYIDEYGRTDQVIRHDGAIPDDTIVVKIGGDHGGGTFKMAFQIANHRYTHSLQSTIPFLVLEAKDSPANLATALQPYKEQVKLSSSMQHNQYTLLVVLFGDDEFQTHNYGLSGSSGEHP